MKFWIFILPLLLAFQASAQWGAQQEENENMKEAPRDRVFTGGGLGGGFSSYYDYISVSPTLGYRVTPRFAPGVGLYYRYVNYKYVTPSVSLNDLGMSVFARYRLTNQLFAHSEYEYLNSQYLTTLRSKTRKGYSSVFIGGGFFQSLGGKAGIYLMMLYNLTYATHSPWDFYPYTSPFVIRGGFTVGF